MKAVGIKELKNKLSHYVRVARAGETVLVTDRDEVVAELRAPTPGRHTVLQDARLADAVRGGSLHPPITGPGTVPARTPMMKFEDLMTALDTDRGDR